jgi:hypothetical protein
MLRLRQVALVARDLSQSESELSNLLDEAVCFRDPGVGVFGLENALFAAGDQFLEIVSPTKEATTAGRLLDKRNGDGGYMVIVQTDQLDAMRARFNEIDVREVFVAEGNGVIGIHLHPKDVGGAILSIDQTDLAATWPWAGDDWPKRVPSGIVGGIAAVEIQSSDPGALAERWSEILRVRTSGNVLQLDDAEIRFVLATDGRGDGVSAVDLTAVDRSLAGSQRSAIGFGFNFV